MDTTVLNWGVYQNPAITGKPDPNLLQKRIFGRYSVPQGGGLWGFCPVGEERGVQLHMNGFSISRDASQQDASPGQVSRLRAAIAACGLAVAVSAVGADVVRPLVQARPGVLNLRTGDVDLNLLPGLDATAITAAGAVGEEVLLILPGSLDEARRAVLDGLGVRRMGYLPTHCFVADVSKVNAAALLASGVVSKVTAYPREWKVDPAIGRVTFQSAERIALARSGQVAVRVVMFPGVSAEETHARLGALPGAMVTGGEAIGEASSAVVVLPLEVVNQLRDIPGLRWAEELSEFAPRDFGQRWIVQSNVLNSYPIYVRGLTGAGQTVGVIDGWMAVDHCAFQDTVNPIGPSHRKIVAYNTNVNYDIHGTHVAGIVAGDPGVESAARGVAYGARLAFNIWPSTTQASFLSRFSLHESQGARIHTNSYGNDATIEYDYASCALDTFLWGSDGNMIVWSTSNSSTLRNPENAKSVLSTGATGNNPSQDSVCSGGAGPTMDGRRKPDLMAPGCSVFSATNASGCLVAGLSGTSMAGPAMAGVGALVRQYFAQGYYPSGVANIGDGFSASGPLVKAMLIAGGVDMAGTPGYPSEREGWGRIRAASCLVFAGEPQSLVVKEVRNNAPEALVTGSEQSMVVRVIANDEPMRVVLSFFDAPATLPATFAPVNDIDLILISPSGQRYFGNFFNNGVSAPNGTPDGLNSTEVVQLPSPEPGLWTVTVRGSAVNEGRQGFGLVAVGHISRCSADVNNDGVVDFFDYLDFVSTFALMEAGADFNHDGEIDIFDYLDFVNAFAMGC
jgi:subtilisin family serine protease